MVHHSNQHKGYTMLKFLKKIMYTQKIIPHNHHLGPTRSMWWCLSLQRPCPNWLSLGLFNTDDRFANFTFVWCIYKQNLTNPAQYTFKQSFFILTLNLISVKSESLLPHHWVFISSFLIPFHGLIRNSQTWLLDGIVLLSLSEAPIGRGVGEDGVRHGVGGVALHAVLDVTDWQLRLQEEVELAVWQTYRHVHHSARTKVQMIIKFVINVACITK